MPCPAVEEGLCQVSRVYGVAAGGADVNVGGTAIFHADETADAGAGSS